MPRYVPKQLPRWMRLPAIRHLRRSRFGRCLASITGGSVVYGILYTLLFSLKFLWKNISPTDFVMIAVSGGAAAFILLVTSLVFREADSDVFKRLFSLALLYGVTSLSFMLGTETPILPQEPWDYSTGMQSGIIMVAASNVLAFFFRLELMVSNVLLFFFYSSGFSLIILGLWGFFSTPHKARALVMMAVGFLMVRKLLIVETRDNNIKEGDDSIEA